MTAIIVHNRAGNEELVFGLTEAERTFVASVWHQSDKLLVALQDSPHFAGRLTWAQLEPVHYRMMIVLTLKRLFKAGAGADLTRSLRFLVSALVRCLEQRSDSVVRVLRIERTGATDATFTYEAALTPDPPPIRTPAGLRIVVDNA